MPIKITPEGQDQLTRLLSQTYACQKLYGDKAEMFNYRDGMFQKILEDFCYKQIEKAFIEHIRCSSDLPSPHDIYKLLIPSQAKLSPIYYQELKRKKRREPSWMMIKEELNYIKEFERQELQKVKDR